jgi:Cys-tRNA(Pro)/Cys-tRNA(Cys) deacylase
MGSHPVTAHARKTNAVRLLDPVVIDECAQLYERISVSAGMRGLQILLAPEDYRRAVNGRFAPIAKDANA